MGVLLSAIRLALGAIARNKARAALTVLGILIGVAAVIAVTALGRSASDQIAGQIEAIGTNVIFVFPQSTQQSGVRSAKPLGRLTEGDARAVLRESVSVASIAPYLETNAQVVIAEKNANTKIIGTTREYFPIRGFKLTRGTVWSESDEQLKNKVCILGRVVVERLFGDANADPVGQVVRIGKSPYLVIGSLAERASSSFGEDENDRILTPIGSFRARVAQTSPGRVDTLIASSTSANTTERAVAQITAVLRQRHGIPEDRDGDFAVRTQAEFREKQESIARALRALLLGVAAVSLLVGGIGVMNIMLVSVAERTREIGIRLSIGAQEADILVQFLVEAVVLSLLGGLLGIAVGVSGTAGIGFLLDWDVRPSASALLLAVATSGAIGILFGYLPARRAAKLDPIDALRAD